MKHLLIKLAACALVALSVMGVTGTAQAQAAVATLMPRLSMPNITMPNHLLAVDASVPANDLMEQVRSQILPQFETILRPEQRDRLQAEIVESKASLRKAFKKIALSSEQKTKLATVFKSLPKKDFFASLTPEQKQGLFSKKEMFKPSPEAISNKINAKMQMAKDKGAMMPSAEAIGEKISAKMKLAKEKVAAKVAPAPAVEKATESLNAIESKVAE